MTIPICFHRLLACLAGLLLPSCATVASLRPSKTHYLGAAREIVSCRESEGRVFVTWRAERAGGLQIAAIDLRTRNVAGVGSVPADAKSVPVATLADEASPAPSGAARPCLGVWKVHPGQADSLWMPRVRWIDRGQDWAVNLPGYGVGARDLAKRACLLPLALVKDGVMTGTTFFAFMGGAAPDLDWWNAWDQGVGETPSPRRGSSPEVD